MRTVLLVAIAVGLASPAAEAEPKEQRMPPRVGISELAPDRFQLVYSGTNSAAREEVEEALLLGSARVALAHEEQWFALLAMPGEMTDRHPPRRTPTFGAQFGHWQPHWNYYVPQYGWQWCHPEWGDEFWMKDVDPKLVQRFEVHAMIELG